MGWRGDNGSASVEIAVTAVFILLVAVLIVEVGNVWYARVQAEQAAGIAARSAALHGRAAGEANGRSVMDSSGCFSSPTVVVHGGENRGSRVRAVATGNVRPRLSPWPSWARGLESMRWTRVEAEAYSMREGVQ